MPTYQPKEPHHKSFTAFEKQLLAYSGEQQPDLELRFANWPQAHDKQLKWKRFLKYMEWKAFKEGDEKLAEEVRKANPWFLSLKDNDGITSFKARRAKGGKEEYVIGIFTQHLYSKSDAELIAQIPINEEKMKKTQTEGVINTTATENIKPQVAYEKEAEAVRLGIIPPTPSSYDGPDGVFQGSDTWNDPELYNKKEGEENE